MRSLKFNFVAMSLAVLLFVFSLSVWAGEIQEGTSKVDALIKLRAINPEWIFTNKKVFIKAYFRQIIKGEYEIVQLFRIAGLGANTVGRFLKTATMIAANSGQQQIFDDLVSTADLTVTSKTSLTVSLAAAHGGTLQMIKTLKERGADFTATTAAGNDHLMTASWAGNVATFEALFDLGLVSLDNMNVQDMYSTTWLISTVKKNRLNILVEFTKDKYNNYLLQVNFALTDSHDKTARAWAQRSNQPSLVAAIDKLIAKQKELRQAKSRK